MRFDIKTIKELASDAFNDSISLCDEGHINSAHQQYGRGCAFVDILIMIMGCSISEFAPDIYELSNKAWIKLNARRSEA